MRQLIDDRSCNGEATDSRIEDSNGRIGRYHNRRLALGVHLTSLPAGRSAILN